MLAAAFERGEGGRLVRLAIYNTAMGDAGASRLAEAFGHPAALAFQPVELDLHRNGIGDAGATALAGALLKRRGADAATIAGGETAAGSKLAKLDLSDNEVGAAGAVALAMLVGNEAVGASLAELWLSWNAVGDVGAAAVAAAIGSNPASRLRFARLSNNGIGDKGCGAIANLIRTPTSPLEKLELDQNAIGNAGAAALRDAIMEVVVHRGNTTVAAELPAGWVAHAAKTGRAIYRHEDTGQVQLDHPAADAPGSPHSAITALWLSGNKRIGGAAMLAIRTALEQLPSAGSGESDDTAEGRGLCRCGGYDGFPLVDDVIVADDCRKLARDGLCETSTEIRAVCNHTCCFSFCGAPAGGVGSPGHSEL